MTETLILYASVWMERVSVDIGEIEEEHVREHAVKCVSGIVHHLLHDIFMTFLSVINIILFFFFYIC